MLFFIRSLTTHPHLPSLLLLGQAVTIKVLILLMFVVRYVWCLKWKVLWFVSFAKNYYFFIVSLLLIMLGTEEATDYLTKSTLDCCLAVHVLISINYYICFMDWASALCQTDYCSCHKQWSCAVLFGPTGAAVDSWYISGTNRILLTAFQVRFSIIIVYAYYRDSGIDIVFSFSKLCAILWWIMCHFPVKRPIIAPTQIPVHRTRHSVLLCRRY